LPVALKLEVGDVNVTASRESIDYSEKTIKMIKSKLDDIKAELIQILQKQYSNVRSLEQYYITKHSFGKIIFPNQESININNLVTQKVLKFSSFKYEGITLPPEYMLFDFFFKSKRYGRPARKGGYNKERAFQGTYDEITKPANNTGVYYVEGEFKRKLVKQAYLRDVNEYYNIITRKSIWNALEHNEEGTIDTLNKMFDTKIASMYNKDNIIDEELELIMSLQDDYMDIIRNSGLNYDEVEIPEDFIEQRKLDKIVQTDANILVTVTNEYKKSTVHTNVLRGHTGMIFYGTQEDRQLLQAQRETYEILFKRDAWKPNKRWDKSKYQAPMFLEVAKKYLKYITPMEHAHHCTKANAYLFHRKQDEVNTARYASNMQSELSCIEYLYKSPNFKLVNENVHRLYGNTYLTANNLNTTVNNYSYYSREIHGVIERQDMQITPEVKKLNKDFNTLMTIIKDNEQLIRFFNASEIDKEEKEAFANVLKKVMVFPENM
jgi:hypothetical protein